MTKGLLLTAPLLVVLAATAVAQQSVAPTASEPSEAVQAVEPPAQTPPAEAPPAEAPPAAAPAPQRGPEQASYDLQLHELEDRLNELKEDVFASKARLRMLWHQLMQERIGGSRLVLSHVNDLGGVFDLVRVSYALDGNLIYATTSEQTPNLARRNRMEVHTAPVLAGPHTISVQAEIRGNDHGVFAYMNEYSYTLQSQHTFTIPEGKTAEVDVVIRDQGARAGGFEERLDVRYGVELFDTVGDGVPTANEGGVP